MTHTIGSCSRCHRPCHEGAADIDRWNGTFSRGALVAVTCPGCQSAAEGIEAEVNGATLDYGTQDALGRVVGVPKAG